MTEINTTHRPLIGGIQIVSARLEESTPDPISSGTLTALATRKSGQQKVLVTCQHVMAGVGLGGRFKNVNGDEEMYQPIADLEAYKVGNGATAEAFTSAVQGTNREDVAYCLPTEDIPQRHLSFYLHSGDGSHESKLLVAGTVEPEENMEVTVLGSRNGEYNLTINAVGQSAIIGLHRFVDVAVALRPCSMDQFEGDSGAPVIKETEPNSGRFNLVGMFVGGVPDSLTGRLGEKLYILPASHAERELGIIFGKRDPIARSFASPEHSSAGETVRLDASNSRDPDNFGHDVIYPDRRDLIFAWEQIEGSDVENFQTLPNGIAVFTIPETTPIDPRRPTTFRLTVTDTYGLQATTEVRANRKPIVNVANLVDGVIDAVVGTEVTLDASESWDPDGDRLFFSWDQHGPGDPVIDADRRTERRVAFTPGEEGTLVFDLTVSDGLGGESTQRVTIVVASNRPPIANAGGDQQVGRNVRVHLSGAVQDLDIGQFLTHEWTKVYGPTVTLHDAGTLTPYFDAPDASAIFIWKLTVRDPLELEHSKNVWVFVDYTPDTQWQDWLPVVPPRYQGSGALREQFHTRSGVYLLPPIDREGNPISDRIPASSGGSSTTRSSTRSTVPGTYVPFVADPFNPGRPDPELYWFPAPEPWANAGPDQTVNTGETVDLTGSAGGYEEGEHVVLAWAQRQGPRVTLSTFIGASPSFTAPAEPTVLRFELLLTSLTRNRTIAIDSVTITVGSPPPRPNAEAGSDQNVDYGDRVDLNGIGSTPVGKLRFSWTETSNHGIFLESAGTAYPYFTAPDSNAVITVQLTVTHTDSGETATDSVTITVGSPPPPPPPPTANAGTDQTVNTGATVTLDGSGSRNATGYSWARTGGLTVMLQDANTVSPTFTAPSTTGSVTFQLTVRNSAGQTDTDSVTITVGSPPPPPPPPATRPNAEAGSDQNVEYGDRVDLDGIGSTPVGKLRFSWTETSNHGIFLESAGTAYPYFTAPDSYAVITVQLTVTHTDSGETATDSVTITVGSPPPPPPPPTANAGTDQTVNTGATVTLDGSGSRNATGYSWARTGGLTVMLQDANTVSPTFTAPSTTGSVTFQLTVRNSAGQTDTDSVTITVGSPPPPPPPPATRPNAEAGSDQNVDYGERVDLDGIGSTPVGKLRFSWTETSNHGIFLESAGTAYPYFTAPDSNAVITVQLTVTHTDSGETATDSVTITVGSPPPPPPPPTANAGTDQTVNTGATVTLDGSGSRNATGYSWARTGGLTVMLQDANTVSPTFTAPSTTGSVTFQLTVRNSAGQTDTDSVTITVGSPPPPPPPPATRPNAEAGSDQNVDYGERVDLDGIGSTPVGKLRFSWTETSNHGIFLESAGTAYPYFTAPDSNAVITVQLTVTHTDSGETATDSVTITVGSPPPPPPPPTANAGTDQTVNTGATVTLDGSGSRNATGYSWARTGGLTVMLQDANTVSPTFTAPSTTGSVTFQLTVRNSAGQTDTDSVTITVGSPPPPPPPPATRPNAEAGSDQNVDYGERVDLDGIGSTPVGKLRFSWTETSNHGIFLESAGTAYPYFTAPDSYAVITVQLTVTHTDSGETATDSVTITVGSPPPPPPPPTANAGTDQTVNTGATVTLDGSGSRNATGYSWARTGGLTVMLQDANTVSPTFTAPSTTGSVTFQLTVRNSAGQTDTDSVTITVGSPPPPPPPPATRPNAEAGSDQNVDYGDRVDLDGIGSTPVGKLRFSWSEASSHGIMLESAGTAYPYFTAPDSYAVITLQLTVTHTDSGETATDSVTITIGSPPPPPPPPTANAGTDQTVNTGATVTLDGSGSRNATGYSWARTGGLTVMLQDANTVSPTFTAPSTTGSVTFQFTVRNSAGQTDTDSVTITVGSPPPPPPPPATRPNAEAGSDQNVEYGDRVDLDGIGSTPVGKLRFSWSEASSHGIMLESAGTAYPYFTAPETYAVITVQLTVTHTDSGETATDSVTITIGSPPPPPPAPTANAGSNQSVGANVAVTLDGSGSSGGTGTLSYSWAETTNHNISLTGADTVSPSFTSPGSAAIVTVQLTVTDSAGRTATDSVTITVTAPPPPPPPGVWSDWSSTGVYKNENGRRWRQEMRHDIDDLSITEERWVDIGALSWGSWTFVRHEGSGASRVRVEQRTTTYSSHNTTETREAPDPEEIWGEWTPVEPASYEGIGEDRERLYERTSNLGNRQTRWQPDPEEIWGAWRLVEPAQYQGNLADRERLYVRTSNLGNRETEWRSDPEPEIWPDTWTSTDTTQDDLADRERLYERFSNYGNRQTVWRSDPEPEVWGTFVRRSTTRGSLANRERLYISTSNYGNTRNDWRSDPEPEVYGAYVRTGTTRGSLANRERLYRSTSNYGNTRDDWRSDPEPEIWPDTWTSTDTTQDDLADRERLYERFSNYGNRQTVWRSDPEPEVWGTFVRRSTTRGSLANRERLYISTSNYGNTRNDWRSDPEPEVYGAYVRTGTTRGSLTNRERLYRSTSNYGNTRDDWRSDPEPETWRSWTATNTTQGELADRERLYERFSNYGNRQTVWRSDPEPEVWGTFVRRSTTRGSLANRERLYISTSNYGNTRNEWRSDPEPIEWGDWTDTGSTRGSLANREKEQRRTSNYSTTETRWVSDPEGIDWGDWEDTGNYRGSLGGREKEQRRTSNYNTTETQWVSDPEPETWGSWTDTGNTDGSGVGREKEQSRTSNYGNTQYQWVPDPEGVTWGAWTDTGTYRGSLGSREQQQRRISNYGDVEYRWVSDPESETWGSWTNTSTYRGSGANRERQQERTSNYGNRQTRWVDAPVQPTETWGSWTNTSTYRGSLANRERQQQRTSNLGNTQTRWVADPEPVTWSAWAYTGIERENDDTGLTEYEQSRYSNYGNWEYRWIDY